MKTPFDGGDAQRCWSCDAPRPVEHHCEFGHVVWACADECAITKATWQQAPPVKLAWDDCPECQDGSGEGAFAGRASNLFPDSWGHE